MGTLAQPINKSIGKNHILYIYVSPVRKGNCILQTTGKIVHFVQVQPYHQNILSFHNNNEHLLWNFHLFDSQFQEQDQHLKYCDT
ncbi:MAG: hypothetical protein LBC75_06970 [Fibromonadaceae bacterium]|nr:hypothetical protein [Fibromonadaceae bacterium]